MRSRFFKDVPVNGIIIIALVVFIVQAFLSMYYNNNALIFSKMEAFNSITKAGYIADMDFGRAFSAESPGRKEANGALYPLLLAPVYKIAGKSNIIPLIYILDLLIFVFVLMAFYNLSRDLTGKETAFPAVVIFGASAPAVLGIFSGADVSLLFGLFAFDLYLCYFLVPPKKYTGVIATSALMFLTGYMGVLFGSCFIIYAVMKANEKKVRKSYGATIAWTGAVFALLAAALLAYVFIENFTVEYLRNNGILDVKTWTVDTFFKDGFLWSKMLPPFFAVFFFIALFISYSGELKAKNITFVSLVTLLSGAALLAGFFSVFSPRANSFLFMPPFYMCIFLFGIKGLVDFSKYLEDKKSKVFSAGNILYGVILFLALYNCIFTFNRTIEHNGMIQYLVSDRNVEKLFER